MLTTDARRVSHIAELVRAGIYPVEPFAVAQAMEARATVRRTLPEVAFRADVRARPVRSFRAVHDVPSFRLVGSRRR